MVGQGRDDAGHETVATLGALVGVGVRAQGHELARPLRLGHLGGEDLRCVDLDDDFAVEVLTRVEVEVAVGAPREAVDARVGAPAVGLIVHEKGIPLDFGTRLSADFARTSWKVIPANSGVRTPRTSPLTPKSPATFSCSFHRMPAFEHVFESVSRGLSAGVLAHGGAGASTSHPSLTIRTNGMPKIQTRRERRDGHLPRCAPPRTTLAVGLFAGESLFLHCGRTVTHVTLTRSAIITMTLWILVWYSSVVPSRMRVPHGDDSDLRPAESRAPRAEPRATGGPPDQPAVLQRRPRSL